MMKKLPVLVFALTLACQVLYAQDPVFSQFYSAPLHLNPAFAGVTYAPRITFNYRNQWPSWPNAFVTYAATYEQPLEELNSGLGVILMTDDAGDGIYQTHRLRGVYSYQINTRSDFAIKFGIEAGIIQTRLDWNRLVFLDQLDPLTGEVDGEGNPNISEEQPPENLNTTVFDIGAGVLAYGKRFYGGLSVKHLNRPIDQLLDVNENLVVGMPLRLNAQLGAEFVMGGGNNPNSPSFISPNVVFIRQADFMQVNLGAYASYDQVFAGLWYRHTAENPDAAIASVGYRYGVFQMGYSYDFTLSSLGIARTGGTHEISLTINFENSKALQRKRRASRYNDCLKLFK